MASEINNIKCSIEGYIENACNNIFRNYSEELAKEPMSYIIYSVWGVSTEGELTDVQKTIHAMLEPTVEHIFRSLALENLRLSKKMGIEYLIRGFIISRLFFMVELLKSSVRNADKSETNHQNILNNIEIMGHA
ncbi:MAG: hypothetical protein WCW53_00200 [Syntrophales bacterium]|jgi:hypothetical protein